LKKTFAVDANGVTALSKIAAHAIRLGGTGSGSTGPQIDSGVIRVSSALVSSQSPFTVEVMNAAGSFTTFQIPGQKVVKIPFSRENSTAGNAALFNGGNSSIAGLMKITDMESPVDVRVSVVIDGALDD
jgi:hypothetical protein